VARLPKVAKSILRAFVAGIGRHVRKSANMLLDMNKVEVEGE
jgi:hypothetical protein